MGAIDTRAPDLLSARTREEAQAALTVAVQCIGAVDRHGTMIAAGALELLAGPPAGWIGVSSLYLSCELRISVHEFAENRWWIRVYDRKQPRTCFADLMAKREDTGRMAAVIAAKEIKHG